MPNDANEKNTENSLSSKNIPPENTSTKRVICSEK